MDTANIGPSGFRSFPHALRAGTRKRRACAAYPKHLGSRTSARGNRKRQIHG
uniref:Uncharacterized protein n=1 Tax=Candidatus Kentrum sp. DK TaxID=2126562 RepID=A0A450TA44_9GAMM|nr:MAG: hypothetical protein BECKDK2373B_GA0170837_11279 [Candidatus Kentron sp. DK]